VSAQLYAQEFDGLTDADQLEISPANPSIDSSSDKEKDIKKFDFETTVGTGFNFSPGNLCGSFLYFAPGFSYMVGPRLWFTAGVAIEHAWYYPLDNPSESQDKMLPMTRAFLYTNGSYLLSNRLTVHGIIYKSLNELSQLNSYNSLYNYQGMGVGINYKISNSFSVGFQMRVQQNSWYPFYEELHSPGYVPDRGF
jgi:hypothetical protein